MCGISGAFDSSQPGALPSLIRRVNNALAHRGPDAEGFLVEGPLALGHRRLSIIDLSTAANQPFEDASRRYVMVFNGEIYNFKEIRSRIPEYPFRTSGDTEVVIAAFAKWGPACLDQLKGMFAIAIWDRKEESLFLARDRFGVKPLYYFHDGGRLLFASEIRAILASGWVPRRINKPALTDYLKYQAFVSPLTIVDGVLEVPAGSYMTYKEDRLAKKVYWDITRQKMDVGQDITQIRRRIRELLYQSVERRLVSDVPLGAFLSGGIDSSAVVAIMSQVNPSATNAFTIAFDEKEYNELPYAELVARKFRVNHSRVLLRPADFLEKLPAALDAMDTPSGDGLNTYIVSDAIKKDGMTVALSGIGGDELFAGYPQFKQFYSLRRRAGLFDHSAWLRKAATAFIPASDQRKTRIRQLLSAPASDIAHIYPAFRQIQTSHSLSRLMDNRIEEANTLEQALLERQPAIVDFEPLSQVSIAEYLGYTQSVLLKDTDQMGMAVSMELREPFFDNDLVEYVLNVPDRFKYPAYPKQLLVESLDGLLPDEIVFRKKQGFVIPYDIWMRNELKRFCAERIANLADRDLFSGAALPKYWKQYLAGDRNIRWMDVWVFIVLEYWLEKNEVC
ncbi:MAG TPA: asparagine synthase (glutamine-hydrolyzing) [Puia sp.]|nr:asparagine synthase (glutamine-hydrolyzing) [Puia sp.]